MSQLLGRPAKNTQILSLAGQSPSMRLHAVARCYCLGPWPMLSAADQCTSRAACCSLRSPWLVVLLRHRRSSSYFARWPESRFLSACLLRSVSSRALFRKARVEMVSKVRVSNSSAPGVASDHVTASNFATYTDVLSRCLVAFASMGGGQPIGFSVGLTLGGVFSNTIGWRWGFHMAAIINTIVFVIGLFGLPKVDAAQRDVWKRLRTEIDWVGIAIGAASLAMLSYSFA